MMDDTEWSWTSNVAQTIATTSNTIKVDVPCGTGVLTVRIGTDREDCFHTHMTLSRARDDGRPGEYLHGFYRHPDGRLFGPNFSGRPPPPSRRPDHSRATVSPWGATNMEFSHSIFVQQFLGCPEDVWAGL